MSGLMAQLEAETAKLIRIVIPFFMRNAGTN